MSTLENLKKKIRKGRVYRREDLAKYSKSIDRHLAELVEEGLLIKLTQGLYHAPKVTSFGIAPPDEDELIKAYLKGDDYLVTSPNYYNALGLGTTQLYNTKRIYNHKKHDNVTLGNRVYEFRRKPKFPKKLSNEYVIVDLLNNLKSLAEDYDQIVYNLKSKIKSLDSVALRKNASRYGSITTRKIIEKLV